MAMNLKEQLANPVFRQIGAVAVVFPDIIHEKAGLRKTGDDDFART